MALVGGYTLDLYCDNEHPYEIGIEFPFQVFADGPKCYYEIRKTAKKLGWRLTRDGKAYCPICTRREKLLNSREKK